MSPFAEAPSAARRVAFAATLVLALPVPFLVLGRVEAAPEVKRLVEAGLQGSRAAMLAATGIPDEELAALRAVFANDSAAGRVVVFYDLAALPYDAKAQLLPMLESRAQLYRNLLYPAPRDTRMARDANELARHLAESPGGAIVVVDLRQEFAALPTELPFERGYVREEGVRIRHWILRGVGK